MQPITVEELKEKIDKGEKFHLLDVREPHEYEEYNIGGKLLPLSQIQTMQVDEIEDWKNEEVIVHCRSGQRSAMACMILDTLGFSDTKNLNGGVLAWKEKYDSGE